MRRRSFLKRLGLGSLALGGTLATVETAQAADQRFNWKLVTAWQPNFPVFMDGVNRFAQDVKRMSRGQLNILVFAGGELVPALQTFDAVSQGTVEMGHGAAYYWAGKEPAAQFFTAVPFGMNAQGMNAWLYAGDGLKLWREVYARHHLIPLPMGNTGVQMGGWFRKPIRSLADLKGVKMRIPGLGGKVIAKTGVNPVLLPGGEIYTALERGTIDAAEWVGPYHDLRLGLHRAAKYYYYPGWHEPGPALELIINDKAWKSLPVHLQAIVENAAAANNLWMLAEFEAKNVEALQTLQQEHKINLLEFPADVIETLRRLTKQTLDEEAAKDATFRKVYAAYQQFSTRDVAWHGVSESAYARIMK
ncbi:MAG: TRAP transporter substrate-binding protein DctP [Gammaproteobacteria bacterium]|nr:TRAP transporter substrate-binding protein DctP [Gammaproteobacteria bacterium]